MKQNILSAEVSLLQVLGSFFTFWDFLLALGIAGGYSHIFHFTLDYFQLERVGCGI